MSLGSLVSFWLRRLRPRQQKRRPFRKPRLWVECLEERTVFDTGLGASLTPNASFVNNLYIDLLHRQPGPSEVVGWTSVLDAGSSRSQVVLGFLGSAEFQDEVIQNDYLTFLHRHADVDGLAGWQSRMANGLTAQRLLASILSSNEYVQDQGGTTPGWLTGLYRDLLGRAPDSDGLAGWTASLQSGTLTYVVALSIVNSPELYGRQVTGAYQSMLARSPDPSGFNGWVASMEGGLSLEKMALGIDGSDEYFGKPAESGGGGSGSGAQTGSSFVHIPLPHLLRFIRRSFIFTHFGGGSGSGGGAGGGILGLGGGGNIITDPGGAGGGGSGITGARGGTSAPAGADPALVQGTWVAIGPAAINNSQVPGRVASSGRIDGIAADPKDPNTIYIAASGGGVWKTTDGGATWTPLTDNQATTIMGAVAIAPSNGSVLYAGTGEADNSGDSFYGRGILKSVDAGASWVLLGSNDFDRKSITKIAIDPKDPNTAYAAVADAFVVNAVSGGTGIWKTTDGGTTWKNMTTSISTTDDYTDVVIDPNNSQTVYAAIGTLTGATVNGVYKSTNGGTSWAVAGNYPTGAADSVIRVAIAKSNSKTLYSSIVDASTFGLLEMVKSTDSGTTWKQLGSTPDYLAGQGFYDSTLAVDPSNEKVVYAGGSGGTDSAGNPIGSMFVATTDGGTTWKDLSGISQNVDGPHADHHSIAFDANGRVLVGNDGGIWRLDDPTSVSWSDLNGNLQITQFIGVAASNQTNVNSAYGGSQDNGVEKYTGVLPWNHVQEGDSGFVREDFNNPDTVYHTFFFTQGFFERSDDGGATWQTKDSGINFTDNANFYVPYIMDAGDSSHLLLGTDHVYETTDRADNWTAIASPGSKGFNPNGNPIDALATAASDSNTIYVTAAGHIFVTNDHGASWNQRDIPGVSDTFADIQVDPTNPSIAYIVRNAFNGSAKGHVFQTTDGGNTWTDISGDLPDIPTYKVLEDARTGPPTLYVGTDTGVYVSTNSGQNWSVFGTGLPNVQVHELILNPTLNFIGAGTYGRGMFEIPVPAGTGGGGGGGGGGGIILPDDRFDPDETSDTAHDFGVLTAGTQTLDTLTINIHANGLPDYDWFKWTAGQSGTYTVTINYTPVTTGDLELRVYTRDGAGMLVLLGSSLNTGVTTQSVTVSVSNGEPLFAEVDGLNHIQANYSMVVSLM